MYYKKSSHLREGIANSGVTHPTATKREGFAPKLNASRLYATTSQAHMTTERSREGIDDYVLELRSIKPA